MSRVHRRGVVAGAGKGAAKTYAEFLAHITALATSGERAWGATSSWATGSWTTTAAAATGLIYGSSWNSVFYGATGGTPSAARATQHALPSEAVFNDQVANGRKIFLDVLAISSSSPYASLNRNGYVSQSNVNTTGHRTITSLIRWDGTQAWISNPSTGSAETLYTW